MAARAMHAQPWGILVGNVREPRPRALDLRAVGARRFTTADWADPQIEFSLGTGWNRAPGWDARKLAARFGAWLSGCKDFRGDPEEYLVVDPNRLLVFVHN